MRKWVVGSKTAYFPEIAASKSTSTPGAEGASMLGAEKKKSLFGHRSGFVPAVARPLKPDKPRATWGEHARSTGGEHARSTGGVKNFSGGLACKVGMWVAAVQDSMPRVGKLCQAGELCQNGVVPFEISPRPPTRSPYSSGLTVPKQQRTNKYRILLVHRLVPVSVRKRCRVGVLAVRCPLKLYGGRWIGTVGYSLLWRV